MERWLQRGVCVAFGAVIGALALAGIAYRPELGALMFLCLTSGLPHGVLFDRAIPIFGGALKVTDLILLRRWARGWPGLRCGTGELRCLQRQRLLWCCWESSSPC